MSKKKTPAIRFKGFTDDWEQRLLENEININSGKDYKHLDKGTIPVYGTGGYLLSVNQALSDNQDAIGIGRKGTINKPYILPAPFWTVDTLFYAIPIKQNNLQFFLEIFKKIDWSKKDESTGVPSLSKTSIKKTTILVPALKEQQKIGQYFKALDNLITLHQRKCEKLKIFKKAMLEKMFPKNNKKIPEVRFEGFTDAWEQYNLGNDIANIIGGGTPSTTNPSYWNGNISWYSPSEIGDNIYAIKSNKTITNLGLKNSSAKILPPYKTILFTSRASIGDMAILQHPATTNQGFQSLVIKDNFDVYFIYSMGFLIKDYSVKNASGSTFLEISSNILKQMNISSPTFKEQTKIGQYFKALDNLITLHQRKVEKLQIIKKSMLEKMFV